MAVTQTAYPWMHVTPSPVYPWLQVQVKPPGMLVQAALVLQLLSPGEAHSLMSEEENTVLGRMDSMCCMSNKALGVGSRGTTQHLASPRAV